MASVTPVDPGAKKPARKPPGSGRPNYNLIHKFPLPVTVEGLPPLIPHNPLSILTIVWAWLKTSFWHTTKPPFIGVFSPRTRSVHITDPETIRALWESGIFGKGTLSRSEPTWLDREKRRRGLLTFETSEEITRKRRQERKEFKKDRARKEQEQIELVRKREQEGLATPENGIVKVPELQEEAPVVENVSLVKEDLSEPSVNSAGAEFNDEIVVENLEHLQLTLEEAFFLAFALGVLEIRRLSSANPADDLLIPQSELFHLFRGHSSFPPIEHVPFVVPPNDSFVANYAVYHHYRALGWCIRPGPKFAVDWMLYNRGPPFSHAEFAVITMPSYSHPYWKSDEGKEELQKAGIKAKSWTWLHRVNRVQSQVRKTLLLAYVEMPPPSNNPEGSSPVEVLQAMKIRDVVIRRWSPNRNRD